MDVFNTEEDVLSLQSISNQLKDLGVARGDVVMVHSRLFTIGTLVKGVAKEKIVAGLIDVFLELLGNTGTLIVPTFTLSFCKTGFFDVDRTKSEVGVFPEAVRQHPLARRTANPTHSVAIIGRRRDFFMKSSTTTSFGKGSIFDLIHQSQTVKFLTLGISNPCEAITHVHFLEEIYHVPYRIPKIFTGVVRENGLDAQAQISFFVRNPPEQVIFDQHKCFELIRGAGICRQQRLGNSVAYLIAENRFFDVLGCAIKKDGNVLAEFKH